MHTCNIAFKHRFFLFFSVLMLVYSSGYSFLLNVVCREKISSCFNSDIGGGVLLVKTDTLNKSQPVEKIYLHIDKPYYNLGDTLWFKGYLLDGITYKASKISGLLYVELDDDSAQSVRRVSVKVTDGICWGQLPLTKAIFHEGGYNLRAYTNWMKNAGQDCFFTQRIYIGMPDRDAWLVKSSATISKAGNKDELQVELKLNKAANPAAPVALRQIEVKVYDQWHYLFKENMQTGIDGSLKIKQLLKDKSDTQQIRVQLTSLEKSDNNKVVQIPLAVNRTQNIDVQFLPESGHLVSGIKSLVGFKALGEDGLGISVAGGIYDNHDVQVASFASIHNGMGAFEFTPEKGKTYIAKLTEPVAKNFELPKVEKSGTVLHVNNPENGDEIRVTLNGMASIKADSELHLVGISRDVVYYSEKADDSHLTFTVKKSAFPTGVARFALVYGKQVLNERAVFIDNQDHLNIKVQPAKTGLAKRDKIDLDIQVTDKDGKPVQGNFSLAVTDNSQVRPDSAGNYNILASLLINSALKGTIQSPGYYINRTDKVAWQALDCLMLTQGWTGYDWKDMFDQPKSPAFRAEDDFKIIGHVSNLSGKPIPAAEVLLSSQKPQFITTTVADNNGMFTFKNMPVIDSGSFFLQARYPGGKKMNFGEVSIDKFVPPVIPEIQRHPLIPWYLNSDSVQLNYALKRIAKTDEENLKLTGTVLREVKIREKKIISGSRNRNGSGKADLVFDDQDIKESGAMNLYQLIKQKLPGIKVIEYHGMPTLKLNNYTVVIEIDGGGLPIYLEKPFTAEGLINELSEFTIASFKGMEVIYSRKYMYSYAHPPSSEGFSQMDIINSEADLKGEAKALPVFQTRRTTLNVANTLKTEKFYVPGYNPGYLERRANVLTNQTPEIAVIEITTFGGSGYNRSQSPDITVYRPLPVLHPTQFYSPRYGPGTPAIADADYRSTLFWEPNVLTDQAGKAKVSFYGSDITSSGYNINISGFDRKGSIGSTTNKIK